MKRRITLLSFVIGLFFGAGLGVGYILDTTIITNPNQTLREKIEQIVEQHQAVSSQEQYAMQTLTVLLGTMYDVPGATQGLASRAQSYADERLIHIDRQSNSGEDI